MLGVHTMKSDTGRIITEERGQKTCLQMLFTSEGWVFMGQ